MLLRVARPLRDRRRPSTATKRKAWAASTPYEFLRNTGSHSHCTL